MCMSCGCGKRKGEKGFGLGPKKAVVKGAAKKIVAKKSTKKK